MRSVVIAGASLAGISAARRLRERGFDGDVTLVGEERHVPYQRPPLSKQFLTGDWQRSRLNLRVAEEQFGWRLGTRAERLDAQRKLVYLSDGHALPFDGLVIATGARPKVLPGTSGLDGVFTLRTIDDAQAIRERIESGARKVVIVGAGFVGSEVAASLRKLGLDVTLIDMDRFPMQRVLGETLGELCLNLHRERGVRLEFGVKYSGIAGDGSVEGVRLDDGRIIEADFVVVGVGVLPNVDWLAGSGLTLEDGVVCDASLSAGNGIVAAGDIARWPHPRYGSLRVEHWDNAVAQGEAAAERLLGDARAAQPFAMTPFFWTDQYEYKLQLIGIPGRSDELRIVEGSPEARRFVAVFVRGERIVAAFLFNSMHRLLTYKNLVESGAAMEPTVS